MNKQSNPGPFDDDFVPDSGPKQNTSGYLAHYLPDKDADPVVLHAITDALGVTGPQVPAKDLIDKSFVILGAKQFPSAYNQDTNPYYCIVKLQEDGSIVRTVLGGQAVVEILKAIADANYDRPILVTLREVQGGRFGHYYVLE